MTNNTLPRTIEIKEALVQLTGKGAGMIEVPIYIGQEAQRNCAFQELYLQVEGEETLLNPAARSVAEGVATYLFFSKHVRKTQKLPDQLVLHWGDSIDHDNRPCGMEIACQEVE